MVWERHLLVAAGPAHRLCVQVNLSFEPWPRAACAVLACDEASVSLKGAGLLIQERAPAPFGDLLERYCFRNSLFSLAEFLEARGTTRCVFVIA